MTQQLRAHKWVSLSEEPLGKQYVNYRILNISESQQNNIKEKISLKMYHINFKMTEVVIPNVAAFCFEKSEYWQW